MADIPLLIPSWALGLRAGAHFCRANPLQGGGTASPIPAQDPRHGVKPADTHPSQDAPRKQPCSLHHKGIARWTPRASGTGLQPEEGVGSTRGGAATSAHQTERGVNCPGDGTKPTSTHWSRDTSETWEGTGPNFTDEDAGTELVRHLPGVAWRTRGLRNRGTARDRRGPAGRSQGKGRVRAPHWGHPTDRRPGPLEGESHSNPKLTTGPADTETHRSSPSERTGFP